MSRQGAKLARIAQERGTNPQEPAREAIERLADYDDWFVREVEKGVAQIEGGHTLTHDVGARLTGSRKRLPVALATAEW